MDRGDDAVRAEERPSPEKCISENSAFDHRVVPILSVDAMPFVVYLRVTAYQPMQELFK